jgi:glyoxylase-like metal-dependent hydrolase (beta-lactamase superfamily II)
MSERMKQSDDNKFIPMTSVNSHKGEEVAPDIYYYTNQIVNVIFLGKPGEAGWVMVDAGMPKSADELIEVAEDRFGTNNPPACIVLTHGHFDHVGSIVKLLERWPVPVYAHTAEFPFLTGKQAYPEPDTSVEGGLLAKISSIYPHEPIDITPHLKALPPDHSVPGMPSWRWIHTSGHSPGHASFFRQTDKALLAGDAFVTVRADSFYKVLIQKKEVNGPPRYLTTDWPQARASVQELASLMPSLAITGHGTAMRGTELTEGLQNLVDRFDELAIPDHGKFV